MVVLPDTYVIEFGGIAWFSFVANLIQPMGNTAAQQGAEIFASFVSIGGRNWGEGYSNLSDVC